MNTILLIIAIVAVLFVLAYIISAIQQKRRNSELNYLNDRVSAVAEDDTDEDESEVEAKDEDDDEEYEDEDEDDEGDEENNKDTQPADTKGVGGCLVALLVVLILAGIGYCYTEKWDDNVVVTTLGTVDVTPVVNDRMTCEKENQPVPVSYRINEQIYDESVKVIVETNYSDGTTSIDTLSRAIDWTAGFGLLRE